MLWYLRRNEATLGVNGLQDIKGKSIGIRKIKKKKVREPVLKRYKAQELTGYGIFWPKCIGIRDTQTPAWWGLRATYGDMKQLLKGTDVLCEAMSKIFWRRPVRAGMKPYWLLISMECLQLLALKKEIESNHASVYVLLLLFNVNFKRRLFF